MSLKDVKKGDSVILCGFTGIKLGVFEVIKATEKSITLEKKDGSLMIFSRKTGKQTNVEEGKERYANRIIEDDGSYVHPRGKKKSKKVNDKKPKKKSKKIVEEEPEEENFEDEDFEDDDFEDDEE